MATGVGLMVKVPSYKHLPMNTLTKAFEPVQQMECDLTTLYINVYLGVMIIQFLQYEYSYYQHRMTPLKL